MAYSVERIAEKIQLDGKRIISRLVYGVPCM